MEWSKRSTGRKSHSLRQQNEGHQLHRSAFLNEWMTLFRSKNWSNIEKTNKTKSKKKQVEVHPLLTFPLLPHILFQQKRIGWISVSCVELHFGPDKAKAKVTEIHHQECVASKTIVLQWNMCRMCAPLLAARCIFFFFKCVQRYSARGSRTTFPIIHIWRLGLHAAHLHRHYRMFFSKTCFILGVWSDHTSSNESLCDRPLTEWKQWAWLSQKSKNTLSNTLQAHWLIHGIVFLVNLYKTRSRI